MSKIKKLLLSAVLIITTTAFVGVSKVGAAENPKGTFGTVKWEIVGGDLQLSGGEIPGLTLSDHPTWWNDYKDIITSITIKGDVVSTGEMTDNLFSYLPNLTTVNNLKHLKLSGNVRSLLSDNPKLTSVDLSGFDTSNIESLSMLFAADTSLETLDVTNLVTSSTINISRLFEGCINLREIKGLNTWDVSKVYEMSQLFYNCESLKEVDLSTWNLKDGFYDMSSSTQDMFGGANNIKKIAIGENFYFGNTQQSTHETNLYTPTNNIFYKDNWHSLTDINFYTTEEVIERHKVAGFSDTYVVEPVYFPITYMDNSTSITTTQNKEGEFNYVQSSNDLGYNKDGYIFKGWNTKSDGSGAFKEIGTEIKESTVLYGIWEKQSTPTIATDKSIYQVNDTVQVSGKGFTPNTEVKLMLYDPEVAVGTVMSDSNGEFNTTFILPKETSLNNHIIKASDGTKTAQITISVSDSTTNNDTKPSPTIPHTGDTTNMNMLLTLLGVSALTVFVALGRKRKQY